MSMRDEFEAWAATHFCGPDFTKNSNGDYIKEWMRNSWAGWQASRAALVVELPKSENLSSPEALCLYDEVKFELEAAGVQVKP
ncbi:hypothetical protein [Pseudomonas sp.]|uniref:hypothetical protein n=1 Tax=Pseudomonas sp. TaxID=306 RepID=UPI00289842DF|nr:hypothetical protein [Pseudomonas sp.]